MQYVTRLLTGTEESNKIGVRHRYSNGDASLTAGSNEEKLDYLKRIFIFIKGQDFQNNKDLDPRICKLSITLLLLGVDKTELPIIFHSTADIIHKHVTYATAYLKEKRHKF